MTDRKIKWWIIPVVILLLAVLLLGIYWDAAAVYLAPKAVLTATLTNTFARLEQRFDNSPLHILSRGLDREGKTTIRLDMDTTDPLLGDLAYHMEIQTDISAGATVVNGTVATEKNELDLSLYMDGRSIAIASEDLLQGGHYGITYDTFSEDIRKNQLLSFILGEETISQWEDSIASLAEQTGKRYSMPEISKSDISMAMVGILTLKAQVDREQIILSGDPLDCFAIRFRAEGAEIKAAVEYAQLELPFAVDDASELTATFYVHDDLMVRTMLEITGEEGCQIILTLGEDPAQNDISLAATIQKAGTGQTVQAMVHTRSDASVYSESLELSQIRDGISEETSVRYDYFPSSGEVKLQRDDQQASLILKEAEEGFRIETADIGALLAIITDNEDKSDDPATLTVMKGADIVRPEYKNFDRWSAEDLLTLLGGIGSLVGLKIG